MRIIVILSTGKRQWHAKQRLVSCVSSSGRSCDIEVRIVIISASENRCQRQPRMIPRSTMSRLGFPLVNLSG